MQVLFSRAAQARPSCRCISCGNVTKSVGRRTTTATPRRRIGAGDIFTACYSTILASAAIADAEVKRERRKEWDRVIEEAKSGYSPPLEKERELEVEVEQRTYSKLSAESSSTYGNGTVAAVHWRTTQVVGKGPTTDTPFSDNLRALDLRIKQSIHSMADVTPLDSRGLFSDSEEHAEEWASESPLPGTPFRDPKSRLHVDQREASIARLVLKLLHKISVFSNPNTSSKHGLSSETKTILDAIDALHTGFSKFPNYIHENQKAVQTIRSSLHTSLYKICQKQTHKEGDVDSMIAKICYNLLISTAHPNIITYNIMIGEFTRLKLHDVAEVVIQSYFCDTRFAPTMETTRLLLDHYIAKGDCKGFQLMLDRMRCTAPGVKPPPGEAIGNMRVGMRSIKLLYLPAIQSWAMEQKVLHRNGHLIRKAPRDSSIFDSIIRGCLMTKAVKKAKNYLTTALRDGQQIRSEWIYDVAMACVQEPDIQASRSLLQAILSFWRDDEGNPVLAFPRKVRYAIYQLLGLCGIDVTNGTTVVKHFHVVCAESLQNFLLHLKMESIKERLLESAEWISQLQFTLGLEAQSESAMHKSPRSSNTLESPLDIERGRQNYLERSQLRVARSQTKFIMTKFGNSARRITQLQEEAIFLIYGTLSNVSQRKFDAQLHLTSTKWTSVERLELLRLLAQDDRKSTGRGKTLPKVCRGSVKPWNSVLEIPVYDKVSEPSTFTWL